jgi:hypothetical protein
VGDQAVGERDPAAEAGGEPARLQVLVHQRANRWISVAAP